MLGGGAGGAPELPVPNPWLIVSEKDMRSVPDGEPFFLGVKEIETERAHTHKRKRKREGGE